MQKLEAVKNALTAKQLRIASLFAANSFAYQQANIYSTYMSYRLGGNKSLFKIVNSKNAILGRTRNKTIRINNLNRDYVIRTQKVNDFKPFKEGGSPNYHGRVYVSKVDGNQLTLEFQLSPIVNLNNISRKNSYRPFAIKYRGGSRFGVVIDNQVTINGIFPLRRESLLNTIEYKQEKAKLDAASRGVDVQYKAINLLDMPYTLWFCKVRNYGGRKLVDPEMYIAARLRDNTPTTAAEYAMPFVNISSIIEDGFNLVLSLNHTDYFKRCQEVANKHFEIVLNDSLQD